MNIYKKFITDNNLDDWRKELLLNPKGTLKWYKDNLEVDDYIQLVAYELDKTVPCTSGPNHPMYGKKFSAETRRKISEAGKGRVRKPESIEKQKESNKGFKHSEQSKKLMSEIAKNRPPVSKETKEKISKTQKGRKRSEDFKSKVKNAVIGRIHVTNGIINKFVLPENVPSGFYPGRTMKKK